MDTNKPKIDWLNHALEFLVVIIGILLAFQLNKCSADKRLEEAAQSHLAEIREETKFNKWSLENSIKYAEANQLKLDSLINLVVQKNDFSNINRLSLELLNLGGVYLRKNAYLALTETGEIKYIKDHQQRKNIINLYEYYKWIESFDEISRSLYSSDYYPYLRDNFDLVGDVIQVEAIYTSKKYQNILGGYYRTSSLRLQKYKDCLKEINDYLTVSKVE